MEFLIYRYGVYSGWPLDMHAILETANGAGMYLISSIVCNPKSRGAEGRGLDEGPSLLQPLPKSPRGLGVGPGLDLPRGVGIFLKI